LVLPLEFKEVNKFLWNHHNLDDSFDKYFLYGGLGIIVPINNDETIIKNTLKDIFEDSINKDIRNRHAIRNMTEFNRVVQYLAQNIGNRISAKNLENYFKSNKISNVAHTTIIKYLQ
jgi:predicted AAA+ superfamily ATPase